MEQQMKVPKRELSEVIENMLKEVPDGIHLKNALSSVYDSSLYSSPEGMNTIWMETFNHLKNWFGDRIPEKLTDWEKRVIEIFNPEVNFNENL